MGAGYTNELLVLECAIVVVVAVVVYIGAIIPGWVDVVGYRVWRGKRGGGLEVEGLYSRWYGGVMAMEGILTREIVTPRWLKWKWDVGSSCFGFGVFRVFSATPAHARKRTHSCARYNLYVRVDYISFAFCIFIGYPHLSIRRISRLLLNIHIN